MFWGNYWVSGFSDVFKVIIYVKIVGFRCRYVRYMILGLLFYMVFNKNNVVLV